MRDWASRYAAPDTLGGIPGQGGRRVAERVGRRQGKIQTDPGGATMAEDRAEAAMTTNEPAYPHEPLDDELSLDELARRQGVRLVRDVHDMARPHVFESSPPPSSATDLPAGSSGSCHSRRG